MGRLNEFMVRKVSERNFDPETVDFPELEAEVEDALRAWGVPMDSPRTTEYHDGLLHDARGQAIQGEYKPWLDRIDVALRQQFSEDDLRLTLVEENLHKAHLDYFLGKPTQEFNETASTLETNFQDYWNTVETEIEGGLLSSPRERTIEGLQDMKIAALPEIGINYDQIIKEAQDSTLYRVAKPRILRNTVKQQIQQNEDELLEVAEPLVDRFNDYGDIYHVNPVMEAFGDILESHLTGSVGSKMDKWRKRRKSKHYQLGTDPELYETLVEEYQSVEGTEDEKIRHVMGLAPDYLEEQYENGELPEQAQLEDVTNL